MILCSNFQNGYIDRLRKSETRTLVHAGSLLQRSAGEIVRATLVKHSYFSPFLAPVTPMFPRWQLVMLIGTVRTPRCCSSRMGGAEWAVFCLLWVFLRRRPVPEECLLYSPRLPLLPISPQVIIGLLTGEPRTACCQSGRWKKSSRER